MWHSKWYVIRAHCDCEWDWKFINVYSVHFDDPTPKNEVSTAYSTNESNWKTRKRSIKIDIVLYVHTHTIGSVHITPVQIDHCSTRCHIYQIKYNSIFCWYLSLWFNLWIKAIEHDGISYLFNKIGILCHGKWAERVLNCNCCENSLKWNKLQLAYFILFSIISICVEPKSTNRFGLFHEFTINSNFLFIQFLFEDLC